MCSRVIRGLHRVVSLNRNTQLWPPTYQATNLHYYTLYTQTWACYYQKHFCIQNSWKQTIYLHWDLNIHWYGVFCMSLVWHGLATYPLLKKQRACFKVEIWQLPNCLLIPEIKKLQFNCLTSRWFTSPRFMSVAIKKPMWHGCWFHQNINKPLSHQGHHMKNQLCIVGDSGSNWNGPKIR